MTALDARPSAVPVEHLVKGRPRIYLEVIPQGKAVRVQPVDSDRGRALDRFWTVWVRDIILNKSDERHTYGVELRDNAVIVTSSATQQGLIYTVAMLAQDVRPIRQAPLHRELQVYPRGCLAWEYGGEWGDKERQATSSIVLPHGAELRVIEGLPSWPTRLELRRSLACQLKMADVGKIVELHFALCLGG